MIQIDLCCCISYLDLSFEKERGYNDMYGLFVSI